MAMLRKKIKCINAISDPKTQNRAGAHENSLIGLGISNLFG